jgi:crotonobetainyl-CoA:carnitine CoA-transferase CaiB-like acyl-CoA transferase
MEMASGLAWMTGHADEPPQIPNGPMDPIAGSHATIALLLALEHRRRTGEGMLLEVPMIGGALNVAAELVIEHSAHGVLLSRDGNRSPDAAPQGVYLTADHLPTGELDRWVLISVATDEQWRALCAAIGRSEWSASPDLATRAGRTAAHDELDAGLAEWCREQSADEIVTRLIDARVPAAPVLLQYEPGELAHLHDRGVWEHLVHPVTGDNVFMSYPAQLSRQSRPLNRRHAPLFGEDNGSVLRTWLGFDDEEVAALADAGVIATRPGGDGTAW